MHAINWSSAGVSLGSLLVWSIWLCVNTIPPVDVPRSNHTMLREIIFKTNKNTLELYLRLYRPQLPCYDSTIRRRLRLPLLSKKNKAASHRKRLFRVIAVKVVLQATEWWLYLVFHRTLWNCAYKSIQISNWKYIKCLPCIIVILYVLGGQSFYS